MNLDVKSLPKYSKNEEILNTFTHVLGFIFSLGVLVYFIIFSMTKNLSFGYMIPYFIYALTMMIVFGISSLYHCSKFNSKYRAVLRIIDHSDIYAFVFGTYLPLCLYGITNTPIAITAIILESVFMVAGIILNIIPINNKILKIIAYIIYIIDGWLMIFFYPFGIGMDFYVFLFILLGGVIYSIGAVTYALGKKRKYFHSLFHVFVLLGAITQFIGIYLLFTK